MALTCHIIIRSFTAVGKIMVSNEAVDIANRENSVNIMGHRMLGRNFWGVALIVAVSWQTVEDTKARTSSKYRAPGKFFHFPHQGETSRDFIGDLLLTRAVGEINNLSNYRWASFIHGSVAVGVSLNIWTSFYTSLSVVLCKLQRWKMANSYVYLYISIRSIIIYIYIYIIILPISRLSELH